MFAKDKFRYSDGTTFEPISDAAYEKMAPALRLLSHFLNDDLAVHYICTMHDGTIHNDCDPESPALTWAEIDAAEAPFDDEGDRSYVPAAQLTRMPPQTPSSAEAMRTRAAEILENLADVVAMIVIVKDQKTPGMASVIPGAKRWKLDEPTKQNFPRAMPARIALSAACAQFDTDEPSPVSLYQLARVLLHETGHVMNKAFNGYRRREVFYQNTSATSEAGFEFENVLFGGVCEEYNLQDIIRDIPEPTNILLTEQWPSFRTFQHYHGKSYDFLRREQLKSYATISSITPEFLAKLCDDAFWAERKQRALTSSTLSNELLAPRDPHTWVIRVDEHNAADFDACEHLEEEMPLHIVEQCLKIRERKQARIAALSEESPLQTPKKEDAVLSGPKQNGDMYAAVPAYGRRM